MDTKDIGKLIKNPSDIVFSNHVHSILVIADDTSDNTIILECKQEGDETTLKDISDQFANAYLCLLVIVESPLGGDIYRYNNYGENEWIQVGKMYGYA